MFDVSLGDAHSPRYEVGWRGCRERRERQRETDHRLTLGWKAMAVTKSMCWKQHRHSLLEMCHRRTVLSIDEESRKKFYRTQERERETETERERERERQRERGFASVVDGGLIRQERRGEKGTTSAQ